MDSEVTTPSWIDAHFIQNKIFHKSSDVVESVDVRLALQTGENYSSEMYRVTVHLKGKKQKKFIIIKTFKRGMEEAFKEFGMFDKEGKMLSEVLPAMTALFDKKLEKNSVIFAAKCLYFSETDSSHIVVEDLRPLGYMNAPRQSGLDYNHCKMAVQQCAKFHAASIVLDSREPGYFDYFKESSLFSNRNKSSTALVKGSLTSFAESLKKWPQDYQRYGSKILNSLDYLMEKLKGNTQFRPGKLNVLTHGDLWCNNMMFKYNEDGQPVGIRFVDFQLSAFTSPALDLQYFFHTSTNAHVYNKYMNELLTEYHSTLSTFLSSLGYSGPEISLELVRKEFEEYYFYAFFSCLVVFPIVVANSEVAKEIGESFQHLDNGEDFSAHNKTMYSNDVYMERVIPLLPLFEAKGCFSH